MWHRYLNPEREVPYQAFEVHGLSTEFLSDKPRFDELADDMLAFIEGALLVMHNAAFDFGFLNAELERVARPLLSWDRVVDTLALARRRHPGAPCSLDALCKRYGIDLSERNKHGALLDCRLLAASMSSWWAGTRRGSNLPSTAARRRCLAPSRSDQAAAAAAWPAAVGGGDRSASRLRGDARRRGALAPLLVLGFGRLAWARFWA